MTVFTCSSVNTDYIRFLNKCLEVSGFKPQTIAVVSEHNYRVASKAGGWKKLQLRLEMYVVYPLWLIATSVFASRSAIFLVTSNTFYAPLIVATIGKVRQYRTIHLLYDLYPDALEISQSIHENGRYARLVGRLTIATQKWCSSCIYLGDFLKQHAMIRWAGAKANEVIDIGTDESMFNRHQPKLHAGQITFHYGGQLGHMHDAGGLVAGIRRSLDIIRARGTTIKFQFYVSGAQATYVREALSSREVEVKNAISSEDWREAIRSYQVGLVSLSPGGASVCLPSKTYSMMAGGLAILAICPRWSDLAKLVLENDAGWVVNNSPFEKESELRGLDYLSRLKARRADADIANDFADVIAQICVEPALLEQKRKNAWLASRAKYGVASVSQRWARIIE
jgi:hypothetical protein